MESPLASWLRAPAQDRSAARPGSPRTTRAKVEVRRAREADIPELVAFHRALYTEELVRLLPPEIAAHYAFRDAEELVTLDMQLLVLDPEVIVLIAELEGAPVGYITGSVEEDPGRVLSRVGLVMDWFVSERARNQGVGRRLMESLEELFVRGGCVAMESRTPAANEGSRGVHVALGFWEMEVRLRRVCAPVAGKSAEGGA